MSGGTRTSSLTALICKCFVYQALIGLLHEETGSFLGIIRGSVEQCGKLGWAHLLVLLNSAAVPEIQAGSGFAPRSLQGCW